MAWSGSVLTALLGMMVFATAAPAAVYCVATNGSDTNPGTAAQPWRTITKAANTLRAGDTVYVKAGTYAERVVPKNPGRAGAWITYTPYRKDRVTIDGATVSVPSWGGLVHVQNQSYLEFSGFRVIRSKWAGIYVASDEPRRCSHITIARNHTYDTVSSGILISQADHIVIDGNEVELAGNTTEWVQEHISVQSHCNEIEVRNNYVHDGGSPEGGAEGIDVKAGCNNARIYRNRVERVRSVGIYVDAWSQTQSNIEVFSNTVTQTHGAGYALSAEAGGVLERLRFYNNIAYQCGMAGLMIPSYGTGTIRNCAITNNTLYRNGNSYFGGIVVGEWTSPIHDIVIRNNIVSDNAAYQIKVWSRDGISRITVDHNLINGFRGAEDEIKGSDSIEGDPRFVDPARADFRLREDSPAIDRGAAEGASNVDFAARKRPQGRGVDIGAYER